MKKKVYRQSTKYFMLRNSVVDSGLVQQAHPPLPSPLSPPPPSFCSQHTMFTIFILLFTLTTKN